MDCSWANSGLKGIFSPADIFQIAVVIRRFVFCCYCYVLPSSLASKFSWALCWWGEKGWRATFFAPTPRRLGELARRLKQLSSECNLILSEGSARAGLPVGCRCCWKSREETMMDGSEREFVP